jgi:hypothetical protein
MTLEIIQYNTTYPFAVNVPNVDPLATFTIEVRSQLSNTTVQPIPQSSWGVSYIATNDRYSEFVLTLPSAAGVEHGNGMYNYVLKENGGVIDSGSLKLIFSPGGGTGTQPYISDNETRQAIVYYDPAY